MEKVKEFFSKVKAWVKENPIKSAGICGFVVSLILSLIIAVAI